MRALEALLERLRGGGRSEAQPTDWRLFWSSWQNAQVGVRDRQRAGVHAPLALGRGFALDYLFQWPDGRITTGAAEKLAIADTESFLSLARAAAYADPDGANFAGPAEVADLPLVCEAVAAEARAGAARLSGPLLDTAEQRAASWGFSTWSGSVSASVTERGVLTSRGLELRVASTYASFSFWYEGRMGDGHASREPIPPETARERLERACELVRRLERPERGFAPGSMPVVLHPRVVESLVSTYLLGNLHGDRLFHGQSAFRIEQFGAAEPLFAPCLRLRLEPLVPMDVGSFLFTAEGVPARPLAYIDEGRLVQPIVDLKYAKRLGREPAPGPTAAESLRLEGGPVIGEEEALRRAGRGALVLSLLGLHTQDPTRGDFSVSAPQTLAIREGRLAGGVKAVLTGNFFEVLRDPALGFVAFEGFRTPGLLFEGMVGVDAAA